MSVEAAAGNFRLCAAGLAIARGGRTLAAGISFDLEPGGALLVTGPNGAGKSTLLRVLAGLLPPAAGSVRLDGGGERWPDTGAASHYLGPQNAMKPALSVQENLAFWQDFGGEPAMSVAQALERVALPQTLALPYAWLSTGQKRRIAIARLLLNYRPLWILDEPTSGLDAAAVADFAAMMQAHLDGGGMLVAATHLPLGLRDARTLEIGGAAGAETAA
ncbi:MAG: heme ABC exporter ATP-binding protein CcmA [Beijerinckiaceae bacterium]